MQINGIRFYHEEKPENSRLSSKYIDKLNNREIDDGVYHQLGGIPFKDVYYKCQCTECLNEMKFSGIIDYDDLNIPLYENEGNPVSLIIGDYDCINFYICNTCSYICYHWAR